MAKRKETTEEIGTNKTNVKDTAFVFLLNVSLNKILFIVLPLKITSFSPNIFNLFINIRLKASCVDSAQCIKSVIPITLPILY